MLDLNLSLCTGGAGGSSNNIVRGKKVLELFQSQLLPKSRTFHLHPPSSVTTTTIPHSVSSSSSSYVGCSALGYIFSISQMYNNNNIDDKTIQLFPVKSEAVGDNDKQASALLPRRQVKKTRRGPRPRSSHYRGVTFYRRIGRWESHIWDYRKHVYLGGFDTAPAAARVYDPAALRFRGLDAEINFSIDDYHEDLKYMNAFMKDELVLALRLRH